MEQYIEILLENSLLSGLSELDFWEMTVGEVSRYITTKNKIRKIEAQERASYDYILASLIAKGISISLGAKDTFPSIYEVYSEVFDDVIKQKEEEKQEKIMQLSALRFRQFAQSYNNNRNKGVLNE